MNSTEKIKGVAVFVFVIFSVLFFVQTVQMIRWLMPVFYTPWDGFSLVGINPLHLIFIFVGLAFHIVLYTVCFLLLRTILKNETPFKKKTATLLKIIAIFFISRDVEGIVFSFQTYFQHRHDPIFTSTICYFTGEPIVPPLAISILWFGGFSIIAGLIIYFISFILDYGISLQTQVDETL